MFSQISRISNNRNICNFNNIIRRNLCWIKKNDGLYSIGLTRETLDIYDRVDYIQINKNYFIRYNDELCFIESGTIVESINSPFDCKIVERNENILRSINIDPENEKYSWIVKVEPIIFGNSIDVSLSQTLHNYFNNYRNSQGIPGIQVAHL